MYNKKITKIIDDQGPKPICRHPLDFTVTITLRKEAVDLLTPVSFPKKGSRIDCPCVPV